MLHLMNAFARMGIPTDILLNKTNIPELVHLDPRIEQVHLHPEPGLRAVPSVVKYIKERAPAVILANREPAVRAAVFAVKRSGGAVRVAIRVGMPISVALGRRAWPKRWLRRGFIRYCYRRADVIIANSSDVARDVVEVTGVDENKVVFIPNPTVAETIYERAREPVSHPWFQENKVPVILGIGRLAPQKDFLTLLQAFARLRSRRPCRLVILGEGKQRRLLESKAREWGIDEHVSLPGFVENPFAYLARADLFVLSSAWEGSPNVLIEALALGVPAVAADCGSGPREILQNGRYGPLVPVGDAKAMAKAMEETLEKAPDREGLREAVMPYRVETSAHRYAQVLGVI